MGARGNQYLSSFVQGWAMYGISIKDGSNMNQAPEEGGEGVMTLHEKIPLDISYCSPD